MIELKDYQRELHYFKLRLAVSAVIIFLLFAVLLSRFVYLQVIQHDYYHTKAEDNRISVVPIAPNRGLILDRNGVVLARNYSAYTLELSPSKIINLEKTINELSELVDIQLKDRRRFEKLRRESRNFESLPIRTRLTDEEVSRFITNRYRFPGVEVNARLFRQYPQGENASHVIGYIGRIDKRDETRLEKKEVVANYHGSDYIGKTGLELSYEDELHGTTGFEEVEIDASGHGVRTRPRNPPISGNNLILTLDIRLQEMAEKIFGKYRGALVAIEPSTGGILAFVSKPGFDPNLFVDGIDLHNWEQLNNSLDKPLNNRALTGQYPPGSTIKPFMALAGLEYGKRSPEYSISDPGFFVLSGMNHRYRDWKERGHGRVNMHRSIVVSCDTYYYGLANDLGIDNIFNFLTKFGFGSKTGIDVEGEKEGLVPSQEWKMKRYGQKWFAGDTISVGIGQGYNLVTPLQLAFATAILANNGVVYRPHLVRYIQDSASGELRGIETQPIQVLSLKAANLQIVRKAMVDVTRPGGTAAMAGYRSAYSFAGKTGTAQVVAMKQGEKYDEGKVHERLRDHALFVAFAPEENPKIALAILVENGGHGGSTAAPIARQVLDFYLLGKQPKGAVQVVEDDAEND